MIPSTTAETILAVEGEQTLRELIEVLLVRAGYCVLTAADGEEALELARETEKIDVLLTDLEMQGMDGAELAARFADFHPAAPVLFLTSSHRPIETMEPFEFLGKPFTTDELRDAVRRTLRMSGVSAEKVYAT